MQTFLHDLATRLLAQHGNDLSGVCVVLPGRRSGVFFRKALGQCTDRAIWAPTVHSIEDFITERSGLTTLDRTTLLFRFFEVYQRVADDPQPIDRFAAWAPSFLADINEIDLNLLDAQAVFHDLYSVERIARWNPDGTPPTDFQKRHLDFVRQFANFYTELTKDLLSRNEGYQGLAFRKVAEAVDKDMASSTWKQVIFAGFNALTASEETILQAWQESGRGVMLWDMDPHYVNDPMHEAGHYMRRYIGKESILKLEQEWEFNRPWLHDTPKQLDIIAVQRKVSQAKVAASLIAKRLEDNPDTDFQRTAIVLNDEQLLMPLLHALPEGLKGVNITMGYGLQFSQSAVFIRKLFTLWQNSADHAGRLYHRDLAALFTDTFFLAITDKEAHLMLKRLTAARKVSIAPKDLVADSEIERIVFHTMDATPAGFLAALDSLIATIRHAQKDNPSLSLELEFLHRLGKVVTRLTDLLIAQPQINDLKTLHIFWRQLVRAVQLDFRGEPLSGLQIMGMLETRNLDFQEVILLGVNEGNLPSGSVSNSYLTYDIRGGYGLARQNERDAVTAYHFYRLLHRAQRVTLIYDSDTDAMGKGEVSRYVHQLRLEKGDNITIREFEVNQKVEVKEFRPTIIIDKGVTEQEKLLQLAEKGFSPSALNRFRNCGLQFYFSYVAGFHEQNELTEHIAHDTFGSAVHGTLELLYKELEGKVVSEDDLHAMLPKVKPLLEAQFREQLSLDESPEGRNLLAFEVGLTYVNRVIHADLATLRTGQAITIVKLEEELKGTVDIEGRTVNIKGFADRIDRLSDGTLRIIDYKTGGKSKVTRVTSEEDFRGKEGMDHFFQLLMYGLMYAQKHGPENIRPAIFYVRHNEMVKELVVELDKQPMLTDQPLVDFARERITEVITELLSPDAAFMQTEDEKRCAFCDFSGICQR